GDVFIGCGEHRTSFAVMQMIKTIQEEYPEIHFHLFSGNADAITERLDKGLLDIGLLLEPEINPKYDYHMLPFRETWGILARKDSPLAARDAVTFEELSDLPLIMPSQTSNSNQIKSFFADKLISPNTVATYNLIYNAGLMVEAGMGYALCIDDLINTEGNHPLTFIPITPKFESSVYLFTKKYQVFSKAAKLFLNRLQQEFLNC
ncbi:MAG: LysR family transcriptional regulator substrate-binding protein, partial [Oscillospiraceae bacterium]|nr:LysR family transcriptional regulator substrate-binding protein [Oscillospiraceae bacterium]